MFPYQKSARVLTALYLAGILFSGLFPESCNVTNTKVFFDSSSVWPGDFLLNMIVYIPLACLLMLSFAIRKPETLQFRLKLALLVVGLAAAISFFIESLQYLFIIGRMSSLFDFMANILGAILGVIMCSVAYQVKGQRA